MANEYMKRCSTLLAIKLMQIKGMLRYHCTPSKMAKTKNTDNTKCYRGCRELDLSYIVGGDVIWYSHTRKQFDIFS